jgi:hypothetical protein
MPDSLDPLDAVLGGLGESLKRAFAFLFVSGGAYVLGTNMHEAPSVFSSLPAQGPAALLTFFDQITGISPLMWIGMMLHSVFIWYLLPFALAYLGLFIWFWRDGDTFTVLLTLALVHSVHAFIYAQRSSPLPFGDVAVGAALLLGCLIAVVVLLYWWRHLRENAPAPDQAEPEL